MATGSADHVARLWNPYVPRRPVAVLEGHAVSIVDVVIHENLGLLLSYSKDAVKFYQIMSCLRGMPYLFEYG